jgi:hypothetical protein
MSELQTIRHNRVARVRAMGRDELVAFLRNAECTFPLDFTEEFFETTTTPQIRHIALAACFHMSGEYVQTVSAHA